MLDHRSSADEVRETVRRGYSQVAMSGQWISGADVPTDSVQESGVIPETTSGGGCCGPTALGSSCCGTGWTAQELAVQIGYDAQQIQALPDGANMGLSCGNPLAIGQLTAGQVVLDLGSGGGFDVFLAGPKVGPRGRVIGVDMTPEMVSKARGNIASYRQTTGLDNVEFRLGEIENLPVADASVDVVISNCVINLSPDKPRVWREIARVLRPGGRVAVSDIALLRPIPEAVRRMVEALVGCVAGAVLVEQYRAMIEEAGLTEVSLTPKPEYVAALNRAGDPLYQRIAAELPRGSSPADYITSLDVSACRRGR